MYTLTLCAGEVMKFEGHTKYVVKIFLNHYSNYIFHN
jgi:hypothetical protein